jgi:hypothetical protein
MLYHLPLSYFIDYDIIYLLITSLPHKLGFVEYVCTYLFVVVFLAGDPDSMCEELK